MKQTILYLACISMFIALTSVGCKKEDSTPTSTEPPTSENAWSRTSFASLRVNALVVNAAGYLFAGSDSNGIFRSTDVGATWTQTNNGLTQNHINTIAVNSTGSLFAGTGGPGIFRSTDNGLSWQKVDPFSSGTADVLSIAVNSKGQIFAAMNLMSWVLRSTNEGTSWTALTVSSSYLTIYSVSIDTSGKIYVGTSSSIAISTNSGNSWQRPTTPFSAQDVMAVYTAPSGCVWAGTYQQGLYVSADRATTWNSSSFNTGCVNALTIESSGKVFIGTLAKGVYSSTNNGITCTTMNEGLTDQDIFSLCIHSSGKIFAGTRHGIFEAAL